MSRFRNEFLKVMRAKGMNQTDVYQATGVTTGSISEYVNEKKEPSYNTLDRLAKGLNVSPAAFFDYRPKVPGELGLLPKSVLPLIDDPEFTRYREGAVELYLAGVRHGQIKALVGILGHMTQK